MKAIRVHQFGGPEVMKFEDVPDPMPSAGQVLVRLRAIRVNPVDTYVRSGGYTVNITLPR
jgi:NADPH2:quinone reductase